MELNEFAVQTLRDSYMISTDVTPIQQKIYFGNKIKQFIVEFQKMDGSLVG